MTELERVARAMHGELSRINASAYLEMATDTAERLAAAAIAAVEAGESVSRPAFCRRYWTESGFQFTERNVLDGYLMQDGYLHLAYPCDCQEEGCEGWQMRIIAMPLPAPPKEVGE